MTIQQARNILGNNRGRWELLRIKKALSSLPLLNTIEEDQQLEAAKTLLTKSKK